MPNLIDNLSPFFKSVAACPISKERLTLNGGVLSAPCGLRYENGDLRVGLEFSDGWRTAQHDYEKFNRQYLLADALGYQEADDSLREIYTGLGINGNVLDVGGGPGLVVQQAGLNPDTFVSVDPIPFRWINLNASSAFARHYANCATLCRVPAFAEFLPIVSGAMDYVHMRSCLDHFANPHLALLEAYRVLKADGRLVIGIALQGAYPRKARGPIQSIKNVVKRTAWARNIYERFFDHHQFHPTREGLQTMLNNSGFSVKKEIWEKAFYNVVYVLAEKAHPLAQVGLSAES